MPEITVKQGSLIEFQPTTLLGIEEFDSHKFYILARIGPDTFALINAETGNRLSSPARLDNAMSKALIEGVSFRQFREEIMPMLVDLSEYVPVGVVYTSIKIT